VQRHMRRPKRRLAAAVWRHRVMRMHSIGPPDVWTPCSPLLLIVLSNQRT
jgi:hypothetical protein